VCKVSAAAVTGLLDRYVVLRAGGAMGYGCGPLVVSRRALSRSEFATARVAVPGLGTTACRLLQLHGGHSGQLLAMPYDRIMPAVEEGTADAGVIIHESRFVYPERGLRLVLDLGRWWEEATGLPLPLGVIVARRDLGPGLALRLEQAIRDSLAYARANRDVVWPYIVAHARELDPAVIAEHIATFVNEASVDAGESGRAALRVLLSRVAALEGRKFASAIFIDEAGQAGPTHPASPSASGV